MVQKPQVPVFPYKEDPLIRKMRIKAWYWAVRKASGLSTRDLERIFREDAGRKVYRSCIWNKYRRGEIVPRSGTRDDGKLNLVEQVEARYPGTARWLSSPIWQVADKSPMEMSEIRMIYEGLPSTIRPLFILSNAEAQGRFWRSQIDHKAVCSVLHRMSDLDALTAVLAMVKEAEAIQSPGGYEFTVDKALKLLEKMHSQLIVPNLFEEDLFSKYLKRHWTDLRIYKNNEMVFQAN
jgi:hypothetical protein